MTFMRKVPPLKPRDGVLPAACNDMSGLSLEAIASRVRELLRSRLRLSHCQRRSDALVRETGGRAEVLALNDYVHPAIQAAPPAQPRGAAFSPPPPPPL